MRLARRYIGSSPVTTTMLLLCVVFGGHAELLPLGGEDNVRRLAALFYTSGSALGSSIFHIAQYKNPVPVRYQVCGENRGIRRFV
ncbi:TPA: hypothetical protein ACKP1J_002065 [Serratia liquefaciens]